MKCHPSILPSLAGLCSPFIRRQHFSPIMPLRNSYRGFSFFRAPRKQFPPDLKLTAYTFCSSFSLPFSCPRAPDSLLFVLWALCDGQLARFFLRLISVSVPFLPAPPVPLLLSLANLGGHRRKFVFRTLAVQLFLPFFPGLAFLFVSPRFIDSRRRSRLLREC